VSYGVRVLCRPVVAAGFGLAGTRVLEAGTADEGVASLRDLLAQPDVGVVLVEESFHDRLPEDVRRRLARNPLPIVVPFPGPAWEERPEAAESYIVELLRRVIGYRVRLR
jgi:vacuolar-type H+-ATPase subunit F/Vma7